MEDPIFFRIVRPHLNRQQTTDRLERGFLLFNILRPMKRLENMKLDICQNDY